MKIKIDKNNDTVYFKLDESKIIESEEIETGVILDYDENNKVIGIEFLNISERIPMEKLKKINFETI